MKRARQISRRYEIQYFPSGQGWGRPIAKGFTDSLQGARGTVARHIAREDYYPRAAIIDRHNLKIVLKMYRTTEGHIHIKEQA